MNHELDVAIIVVAGITLGVLFKYMADHWQQMWPPFLVVAVTASIASLVVMFVMGAVEE